MAVAKGRRISSASCPSLKDPVIIRAVDAYLLMTILSSIASDLPAPVVSFHGMNINGNAFMQCSCWALDLR